MIIFLDTGSGTARGIPDPILFDPEVSKQVKLPDNVPVKAGYTFLGWNSQEDGKGMACSPGDTLTTENDLELYAMWKKKVPVTGDTALPALWLGMAAAGLLLLRRLVRRRTSGD